MVDRKQRFYTQSRNKFCLDVEPIPLEYGRTSSQKILAIVHVVLLLKQRHSRWPNI